MDRLMSFNMDFLETSSVCRLCLKISSGGNIQMLEGFNMYMLKLVAPALNLEISFEPKICKNCADKLKSTYDFKSVCLEYSGVSQPALLNKTKPQNEKVCKCCLCDNKDNLKKCKANEILFLNTMLEKCLPELDMEQISTICQECLISVVNLFAFLNYCLDTEDKIKRYVQVKGLNKKGQVPILNVFHANIFVKEENPGQAKVAEAPEEVEDDPQPVDIIDCEEGKSDSNVDSEGEVKIEVSENTVKMEELGGCEKSAQDAIGKPGTSQRVCQNGTKTHSEGKPGVDNNIFNCTLCEYWTKRKLLLDRHMVKHNTQEQPKLVKCDQCKYETKYKSAMVKHKKRHRYKDYVINHIMKNRDLRAGKKFKCDKCPYEADFKYYLSHHNVIHMDKSEVVMHKCDKCDFETKYKKNMVTHMLMHRDKSEVDMHKCEKCDYETKHKSSMTRHRLTHRDTNTKAKRKFAR